MDFGIQIKDGSTVLPDYGVEQNFKYVQLYDWQRRAIDYFFKHNKAIFQCATGTGKSIFAITLCKKIIEKHPKIRILIVVPKNVILETTWYKELYEAGFSLKDIGVYYGNLKEYGKITITNMQSIQNVAVDMFDVIIMDECHNIATKRLLTFFTENEFEYMIGLSATVERMDQAHLKLLKMFDYNLFDYDASDALRDGVINSFSFTNIGVIMDDTSYEKYSEISTEIKTILSVGNGFINIMKKNDPMKGKMLKLMGQRKELMNNYYRKFGALKEICKKHRNDKIIVFNEFNSQTSKCYWYLLDYDIQGCIVHSGIPKKTQDQSLMDFKNDKYNVLLTTKVLDEGYNLPKIDVGIIMAGNSTSKQTIQRMGRVLRKKKKESQLYQIYCLDTVEEKYANKRAVFFNTLCSSYKQYSYNGEVLV